MFSWGWSKKNFFFEKKNSKWPTQKNWVFQLPPKAEQLLPKFHRLVLGLVELIDTKGINVTQPIWLSGCPMQAPKRAKNTKKSVLAIFLAYVGQPDGHISWVTLMPFASINPTNPRTNLWNFGDNCSAFGGSWKTQFFWVGHFDFFFQKKNFFLLHSSSN